MGEFVVHLILHLLIEMVTTPGGFYFLVSGIIVAIKMKSFWWFFLGWFGLPIMVATAILLTPFWIYNGHKYGWSEYWKYLLNQNSYRRQFPKSPIVVDAIRLERTLKRWHLL